MVYERFRTDESSARLAWIGRTTGPRRRGPVAAPKQAVHPLRSGSPQGSRNHQLPATTTARSRSSRAGASLGQQECCDIPARPSFALPGSTPVIQPSTAADLSNRQGPCLRNSSVHTGPASHKCLLLPVTLVPEKLDICLYTGSNNALAHGGRDGPKRTARNLYYHPETGGTRHG